MRSPSMLFKNTVHGRSLCIAAAILALGAAGCSGSPPGGAAGDSNPTDNGASSGGSGSSSGGASVAQVIQSGGDLQAPKASPGNVPVGAPQTVQATGPDGTAMQCTQQKYDLTTDPTQFVSSDPSSDVLWPGSLIQGKSLPSGLLDPVPLPRAPGTITLTLASGAGTQFSRNLQNPSLGAATQAINDILNGYSGSKGGTPAKFSYKSEAVYSSSQLAIEAGVDASGTGWSGSAELSFDESSTENRYLLQFTQSYYTMAFDPPAGPADVFAPSVSGADLQPYAGPNNPVLYISSVTYGRIFYLLFESTASSTDLAAAVEGSYSGGVNVDASLKAKYDSVLNQTTIKAYGIGGDAASAIGAVTQASNGRFTALADFLTTGATFSPTSPGVPISYTVRNLADSTEVGLVFTTEYTAKDCHPTTGVTANLLQNPGAESGVLAPWVLTSGYAGVHQYCSWNICAAAGDPTPPDAGGWYFGGYEDSQGSGCQQDGQIAQAVDLTPYAHAIATGNATFHAGGWLGGYGGQTDNADIAVYFDSGSSSSAASVVTPAASGTAFARTEMLCEPGQGSGQTGAGNIPTDAQTAHVVVSFHYREGACSDDATADSLWFQVEGPGIADNGHGLISCP